MDRRRFIIGAGTVLTISLAGCTSSDPDYEGSDDSGDDTTEGSGDDGDDDDEPDEDDLEIVDHEMVVEEDEFLEEVYVEGIVENNSGEMANYVQVSVRVYDEDGNQLDSYLDNTNDLDGGATWSFDVMVLEDAEDVDDYDIAIEDLTW